MTQGIRYVDRASGEIKLEQRPDFKMLKFIYSANLLSCLFRKVARWRFISDCYGWMYDRPASPERIRRFARHVGIAAEEAEKPIEEYTTLNDFFTRRLKPGIRPIDQDPTAFVSPADSYLLVLPTLKDDLISIKGGSYTLAELLRDDDLARSFRGGDVGVFRLAPPDYHRFHFPDSGYAHAPKEVGEVLDSIGPFALERDPYVYCKNMRHVVQVDSDNFGKVVLIPVGAMVVGTVASLFEPGRVEKGQEHGMFRVGGSAYLTVTQKGVLRFDQDIVDNSARGLETRVKVGESVARRVG